MKKDVKIIIVLCFLIVIIFSTLFVLKLTEKEPIDEPEIPNDLVPPADDLNTDDLTSTFLNDIVYDVELDKDLEEFIVDFFDTYYLSLKNLKELDMTKYFYETEDALINQTALSLLIDIRLLKPNDLRLDKVKYDLNIKSVSVHDDLIDIEILENSYMNFNFMKEIESKIYNISNKFTIKKIDNQYKIIGYDKVQDFYVMITDKYTTGGITELEEIKNNYIKLISEKLEVDLENYQYYLNNPEIEGKVCDHEYDRQSALNYALEWVNKRNTNQWTTFSSNCQNFASQVVYNGGVIFDYIGNANNHLQWKFYNNIYNTSQTSSGYVYTWTYVPYFYQYAKNNTGTGLCAEVDVNIYYAEAGDVIHVGVDSPSRHALVVIGSYEKDGKIVDILVNSNTVDLENYPFSAYVYPYSTLIKIYGWND